MPGVLGTSTGSRDPELQPCGGKVCPLSAKMVEMKRLAQGEIPDRR